MAECGPDDNRRNFHLVEELNVGPEIKYKIDQINV